MIMASFAMNYLGGQQLAKRNNKSNMSSPRGVLFFIALNLFMPIKIESLQGKDRFKQEYYEYLDSEAEGVQDLGLSYY